MATIRVYPHKIYISRVDSVVGWRTTLDTSLYHPDTNPGGDTITYYHAKDLVDIDCIEFTESFDNKVTSFPMPSFLTGGEDLSSKYVDLGMREWTVNFKGKLNSDSNNTREAKYDCLRNMCAGDLSKRQIQIAWQDINSDGVRIYPRSWDILKFRTKHTDPIGAGYTGTFRRVDIRKYENLDWYDVNIVFLFGKSMVKQE